MYIPHDTSRGEEVNRNTKCRFHLRRQCQNNGMLIEYFTIKLSAVSLWVFNIHYVDIINLFCLLIKSTHFCFLDTCKYISSCAMSLRLICRDLHYARSINSAKWVNFRSRVCWNSAEHVRIVANLMNVSF